MKKSTRIGLLLAILLAVGAGVLIEWRYLRDSEPADAPTGLVADVEIGGPFTLTDHTGRPVTDRDFLGRFVLLYFGYTFCPDICPTELGDIAATLDELGGDAAAVTPLFITIDPERDSAEVLAEYVPLFHERLVGLTGTPDQIKQVANAYRVFYRKAEDPDYTEYLMDHTSFVYLLDPDGKVVSMFRYGTPPEEMARLIRARMRS